MQWQKLASGWGPRSTGPRCSQRMPAQIRRHASAASRFWLEAGRAGRDARVDSRSRTQRPGAPRSPASRRQSRPCASSSSVPSVSLRPRSSRSGPQGQAQPGARASDRRQPRPLSARRLRRRSGAIRSGPARRARRAPARPQVAAEVGARRACGCERAAPPRRRGPPSTAPPEHGPGVLDVVVERAVDVGQLARRPARTSASQWSWNWQPGRVGKRQRELEQLAAEQRRGAGDRVRDEHRGEVVVVVAPPAARACRAAPGPSAVDEPLVGVDEGRVAERRRAASASLSGYQPSSWSHSATSSASAGTMRSARSKLR